VDTLIDFAVHDEPSRLREKYDETEDDERGNELNGNLHSLLNLAAGEEECATDPLSTCHTCRLYATFNHNPSTLSLWLSTFGLPCWNCGDLEAKTNAR